MAVIPLVTTSVKNATGPLKGVIRLTGTIDQPEAYGTVSFEMVRMKLTSVENEITGIDGDLISLVNKVISNLVLIWVKVLQV